MNWIGMKNIGFTTKPVKCRETADKGLANVCLTLVFSPERIIYVMS